MIKLQSYIDLPEKNSVSPPTTDVFADACGVREGGSFPAIPMLQWRLNEVLHDDDRQSDPGGETCLKPKKSRVAAVSARRLAAEIWNLRIPEVIGGGRASLDVETSYGQLHVPHVSNVSCNHYGTYEEFISLLALRSHRNDISNKLETSVSLLPSSMERATKWFPGYAKESKDACYLHDNLKLLKKKKTNTCSIVDSLRSEVEQARSKICELETVRQSSKKKLDCFMRKIEEEKLAWRRREHEKIRSVIDAMKEDLNRERKSVHRLEVLNSKLVKELRETKLTAKQLLQEYKKERKAHELVNEVCNELSNEIEDDKAEVEALKMESVKTREEVEEERKMMQMAEVWREERVQMKLIDAKLTLEEKYSQLSKLQEEIEAFLRSRSENQCDVSEIKQAESLKEAVGSLKAHDMIEFSYLPPHASHDIYSIFEELQFRKNVNETGQWYESVAPKMNGLTEKHMKRYDNLMFNGNCYDEDDSEWETVSHVEERDSCKSPGGSDPSVNGICFKGNVSVSGTDYGDYEKQNNEISEVCSVTTRKTRKKGSTISRLWKSSRMSNTEDFKKLSFELTHERLYNARSSNACQSPTNKSAETCLRSSNVDNWSAPNLLKHYITLGMKNSIDWPHAMNKQSLKARLMEGKTQSQKVQLRHMLKQKT